MTIVSKGLSWEEAKQQCPVGVVPACHNSEDTVTVSGGAQAVADFVSRLKEQRIFAKEVKSSGIAFHCNEMAEIAPYLMKALEKVTMTSFRSTLMLTEVG